MGIFGWLFGPAKQKPAYREIVVQPTGIYDFDVVGEGNFQDELEALCGGKTGYGHHQECKAWLVEEPSNAHDSNAVKVVIRSKTVGYLPRREAAEYRRALSAAGLAGNAARVDAIIVGGWDRGERGSGNFGVKLDMDMPPDFA